MLTNATLVEQHLAELDDLVHQVTERILAADDG